MTARRFLPAGRTTIIDHVAICGAGFSGTLQAVNLLRHDGPRATLIERAAEAGKGLAYGAAGPDHLLNVRAGNMSAFPDDPDHFVRWLTARGVADAAGAFIRRRTYGAYLREVLDQAIAGAGDRLRIVHGDVADIDHDADGTHVRLDDGTAVDCDAAVLAVGNLPPHLPPGLDPDKVSADRLFADPWAPGIADGLGPDDTILVIGTGLTTIDTVLTLEASGFAGTIVALSRRGLTPHPHAPAGAPWRKLAERPATVASALVRQVRARAREIGWRNAVDELRPYTQGMWANATDRERGQFLRHLRPWWDVHRHRLSPEIAARIDALRDSGRLRIVAGKTLSFADAPGGIAVTWRPRGQDDAQTLVAARVINCTGPQGDLLRTTEPLLQRLTDRGVLRPDAAHLGIDVDADAQTIAADGTANDWLFALGPMTRGAFWEIVAVPDIRNQTWTLARRLSNAHWVGGEGL